MNDLQLLPVPKRMVTGSACVDPTALPVLECLSSADVPEQGDEAYRLVVRPDRIELTARSATGMRWARATLQQLRCHQSIPCLEIDDAPLFPNRGVMLDISRDRVPTMASLCQLIDHLAAWKMNHLQLYVEHTVAYEGHETVWRNASPLTLEELSALNAYAAAKGVALTANQNCLGHFERWLRHPRYAPLAESPHGQLVRGHHYVAPNTLCPVDPRSMALIQDLLDQLLPRCSGTYANIGCDEPWDLGLGRSKDACARDGKAAVFSSHVAKVAALAKAHGKRAQFWCDPEPNEDDSLPRDLVTLVWQYEADQPLAPRVQAHHAMGRETWVAPGTSCWNTHTGRTSNRRANLNDAASQTVAHGLLCTAWGDGGHRQAWPITLFGFADAAMAAWSGPDSYDNAAAGMHAFGYAPLGAWLAELGDADKPFSLGELPDWQANPPSRKPLHNTNALWADMHTPFLEPKGVGDAAAWQQLTARLQQLKARLPAGLDPLLHAECSFAVDAAIWAARRAALRRGSHSPQLRRDLAADMLPLIAAHRQQWLARCRPGGLNDSTTHFEAFARSF